MKSRKLANVIPMALLKHDLSGRSAPVQRSSFRTHIYQLSISLAFFLLGNAAFSQAPSTIVIKGVVSDKLNKPLSGVSVELVGTHRGVSTDTTGKFSITVDNEKQQLRFSHVGYVSQVNSINNTLSMQVVMDAEAGSMEEVVLVGYGKQKKISLVGAQSTVNVEDLKMPVANLSAMLAGRLDSLVGVQLAGL